MRNNSYPWWIPVILILLLSQICLAQLSEEEKQYLNTQLNNSKILYQKGKGAQAIRLLVQLEDQFPRNAEIKYLISILQFKVKRDKRGMEKYYNAALKINPTLRNPRNLSDIELKKWLSPRQTNAADVNLRLIMSKAETNVIREQWKNARAVLESGLHFYPEASLNERSRFSVLGLLIYDHFYNQSKRDLEYYLCIKYFKSIEPELLNGTMQRYYDILKDTWSDRLKTFERNYKKIYAVEQRLTGHINQNQLEEALLFIDLVKPAFKDDRDQRAYLELTRLKCLVEMENTARARQVHDSLKDWFAVHLVPLIYRDQLKTFEERIIYQETLARIGRQQKTADTLMLRGMYDNGIKMYERMLKQQEAQNQSPHLLYLALSRIHRQIGKYDKAREYLDKITELELNESQRETYKDSIRAAEKFDEFWNEQIQRAELALADKKYSKAEGILKQLALSPYLRFAQKRRTFLRLAETYANLGKTWWAKEIAETAEKYKPLTTEGSQPTLRVDLAGMYLAQRFFTLPPIHHPEAQLKLDFSQTVEFDLYYIQTNDILAFQPPTTALGHFMTQKPFGITGGNCYMLQYNRERNFRNAVLGGGLLLINGWYLITR